MGVEGHAGVMHVGIFGRGQQLDDCLLRRVPEVLPAGAHLDRVIAREQDEIRRLDHRFQMRVGERRQAGATEGQRVVFRQHPLGLVAGDHRRAEFPGELRQRFGSVLIDHVEPGDDQRAFGLGQRGTGGIQSVSRRGSGELGSRASDRFGVCDLFRGDGDGQVDMHGARPVCHGEADQLVDQRVRVLFRHGDAGLGHRAEDCRVIEDLMIVGDGLTRIDAAGQHNQRHPVLLRIGGDVDGVGGAGADSADQHAGRAGHVPDAFGYEPGGILVLCQQEADARFLQRIHQGQHLAPRHAEGIADPRLIQTAGNHIGNTHGVIQSDGAYSAARRAAFSFSARRWWPSRVCGSFRSRMREATTVRKICAVPPPIVNMRASRCIRSIG